MFVKLDGSKINDKLQDSYTATSSDGGFYRGKITAVRWEDSEDGKDADIDPIAPDDPLAYQPTIFFDPDLYWHNHQFGILWPQPKGLYSLNAVLRQMPLGETA